VAVKAQVPVGGRGKAGGIKLAKTADEARSASAQIIGMDIKGFKVPLVYCESALDIEREIYLGFTVDRDARANILMLSAKGGMDIEQVADETPDAIARLYPNPWRGPLDFELTQLAFDAGLGELARPLTALVKKLYRAIPDYDALTAEINPLVVARNGDVIAGGAKAEVVENALAVILMNPKAKGVLINVFGGITRGDEVAKGIVTARDNLKMKLPLVVRMSGTREEEGREILRQNGIEPGASAWDAAKKIVELISSPLVGRSGPQGRGGAG